jgi:serine/threonine protein kinase
MSNGSLFDVLENVTSGDQPEFWTSPEIAMMVCDIIFGIEFLHSRGFGHRDLKPSKVSIDEDLSSSNFVVGSDQVTGRVGTSQCKLPELCKDVHYDEKIGIFYLD